jgi:hypothetical protein
VESLGYAGHTQGSRRARLGDLSRLQTGEATLTPLRRGKAQGHRRGDPQAVGA